MLKQKRFIICKLGLDAHDNGLRIVAKWLMDNGYEVIYAGLYNTPDRIVRMAVEEDADAIGISFLGGEQSTVCRERKWVMSK
jgi:methylmalonyl-CoA mutase C-terminal domain/subunit